MPTPPHPSRRYRWRGRDRSGQWVRGEQAASSRADLQAQLQAQRIRLCACSRVWAWPLWGQDMDEPPQMQATHRASNATTKWPGWRLVWPAPRLQAQDLTRLCRQLATLLQAGLPLLQAVRLMRRGLSAGPLASLLDTLDQTMEAGQPLSIGLGHAPGCDATFRQLVAAGEASGQLDQVLARLAEHREKSEALQRRLRSALVYPGVVLAIGGGVTLVLLTLVVPTFAQLFDSVGAELPALTRAVLALSQSCQDHGLWLFPLLLALVVGARQALRHDPRAQRLWDRQRLRWPVWGALTRQALCARWCRTLTTLLGAGIPLHEALASVTDTLDHHDYRLANQTIRQQLGQGSALAACLERQPWLFEPLLAQMCAVGEESGLLDAMLARMAGHYEQQVDTTVARLATLLEPAILLLLGALMGTLVLTMYWPIFQLGQVL